MITSTWAIALATFKSAFRSKLSIVIFLFSLALFIAISLMTASSLNEDERLLKDLGLFLGSSIISLSMLALCAQTLYRDLERKSLFTLASKPISRSIIVWGKYIGLALSTLLLSCLFALIWYGLAWRLNIPLESVMIKAWLLVWLEALIIGALAMLFGSFSTPLVTSALAFGVMLIGRFADDIIRLQQRAINRDEPNFILDLAKEFLVIIPPLKLYNVSEQVVYHSSVPWTYLTKACLTSWTYSAICLMIASILFARRDLT